MKADLTIPNFPNVSLVAFYGDKPTNLCRLIDKLQAYLATSKLGENFIPYQLEQVHGTIIGCEGLKTDLGIVNKWYGDRRQETKYMNLTGLIDYLQQQVDLPITIRFGGYDRHTDYNWLSRDRHLYERSWQLQPQDNLTIPVLIGWSFQDDKVSLAIDNLRRELQEFNLLHKYHPTSEAIDNDFYLRLGTINTKLSLSERNAIATEIRDFLETHSVSIPISLTDLAFVQYQDLQLTPNTTKVIPVADITPRLLEQLYPN